MAFNFRPNSTEEILSKRKTKSSQAAQIFEAIKEKYDETIILDPTTQFTKIKIPRAVEQQENITQVKNYLKSKKKIDISGINISFGDGSGKGTGTSAVETAQQENATRLYCEKYMMNKTFPTLKETREVYPNVGDEWILTFKAQAVTISEWIGRTSAKYQFSRDEGIMPYLENIAKLKCGVTTKDSWNPADIYAVKVSKLNQIKKDLTAIGNLPIDPKERLDKLNDYMRDKINSKDLIGISLKKLSKGKVKTVELTNAEEKKSLDEISIVPGSINLNLDLNKNNEFETGELSMALDIKGDIVAIQIRAFSGGVRESTQMDMTGKGAAAKLGKVSSREAIDPYLRKYGLTRRMGTELPKVGEWTEADIKKYVSEYNTIKNLRIGGETINWGKGDWEKTLRKAIVIEKDNNRTASQLSAKIQCFQWIQIFHKMSSKKKLKEFLTVLYYGAKKEYDSAGPFLKIA